MIVKYRFNAYIDIVLTTADLSNPLYKILSGFSDPYIQGFMI